MNIKNPLRIRRLQVRVLPDAPEKPISDQFMKQPGKRSFICALSLLFFAGMATPTPAVDDPRPGRRSPRKRVHGPIGGGWAARWTGPISPGNCSVTATPGWAASTSFPIYGAKGWESNYISYLSPKWMDMMGYTAAEAHRLGLGVDMTTGTGWCFGGPNVSDRDANASVVVKTSTGAGES